MSLNSSSDGPRIPTKAENIAENAARFKQYPCCGGVGYVRANVEYGHPNFGKAVPCVECSAFDRITYASVQSLSVLPLDLEEIEADWTMFPQGVDLACVKAMQNYALGLISKKWDRRGVLLRGNNQTGKSGMAYCVHQQLAHSNLPSVYLPIGNLFAILHQAEFAKDDQGDSDSRALPLLMGKLARVRHLVIDDLGAAKLTEDREGKLFELLMQRVSNPRCYTTITTNLENTDMLAVVGKRIYARLVSTNFYQFTAKGEMNALNGVQ